jgi:hypothetical protein
MVAQKKARVEQEDDSAKERWRKAIRKSSTMEQPHRNRDRILTTA